MITPADRRLMFIEWFINRYIHALDLDRPRVSDRARMIIENVDADAVGSLANDLIATINRRTDCGTATGIVAFGVALSVGLKVFDQLPPDVAEEMRLAAVEVVTQAIATFGRIE